MRTFFKKKSPTRRNHAYIPIATRKSHTTTTEANRKRKYQKNSTEKLIAQRPWTDLMLTQTQYRIDRDQPKTRPELFWNAEQPSTDPALCAGQHRNNRCKTKTKTETFREFLNH
jgi:hypothetical protein